MSLCVCVGVCVCVCVCVCVRARARAVALLCLSPVMWIHSPILHKKLSRKASVKNHSPPCHKILRKMFIQDVYEETRTIAVQPNTF